MIPFDEFLRNYDVKKLDERFPVSDFDCGDEDLNDFLKKEVFLYKEQLLAMPYVLTKKDDISKILAYFTLANDKISVTDFPSNSQFNKFKKENFNKEKFLRSYPSVKIGRLAISKELQGQGVGTHLLRFIKMYFVADNKTGCRFITLDAYRGATDFYKRNGFNFLQKEDENPTQLMYFDLVNVGL
ncbi:MAG: GNAT family N-acetyltransferase [Treponema sp.]|nr:GNAT family N-acetyltransferase [Treponema sp.]